MSTSHSSVNRTQESAAKPKLLPPHAILLHDDDIHTAQYVIEALAKVFGYDKAKCTDLTYQTQRNGKCAIWRGTKELAELKCEQIQGCGPDNYRRPVTTAPLMVTIEPC